MDYFDDAFHTFLGLDSVIYLAVNGTVTNLPVFIQNIYKLCSEDKQSFYGFGMIWGSNPLMRDRKWTPSAGEG